MRCKTRRLGASFTWILILARIVLTLLGGYAAAAGIVAVLTATLPFTGLPRIDSDVFASMLGFVIYLVLFLWGFAERRLVRLAAVQAFLAAGGFGLASLIGAGG